MRVLTVLLATAVLFGCGASGPAAIPVNGTVTLDGKPLAEGLITFKTIQTGAVETLNVKDGNFTGSVQEGDRRVEIYAFHTKTQDFSGMKTEVKESLIPKRYNVDSTLNAVVTHGGPNQLKFELKSSP